ncbi:hypothetical protein APHAL10511_003234 [Amanita phalloides]|nr:hypothetical protein APHAL10511_003234 [Amanita phalloides]
MESTSIGLLPRTLIGSKTIETSGSLMNCPTHITTDCFPQINPVSSFSTIPDATSILVHYITMHHLPLFRRRETLIHERLPPSFLPSMIIPPNVSSTIPSLGDVSMANLTHASQATKRHLINVSQDVGRGFSNASPSWFRDMAPVRITCRDWTNGEIFDWYQRQPYTTVSKLELRKERDHFRHEFIVIYLDNGWYHRIDRRPVKGANVEAISKEGCEAEDSLTPVSDADLAVIRSDTDAEITLEFKSNMPDLYNVIAVAVAIHLDPQTKNYTLQQYNCYFVARSVIALMTRHCLLRAPVMTGLRWDNVTEPAIFHHIFGGNWNKLANVMKACASAVLDNLLWDVIKADAGTRIEKKKDWSRLRDIVRRVIHEDVEGSSATLAVDAVQRAVNEWIIRATQAALWYKNFDQALSERRYVKKYETIAEGVLRAVLQPELEARLPGNILKGLSEILPERLINRIPPSVLARLPPEMMARASVKVLEKLPDDFIAKLPYDVLRHAPSDFLQKIPVDRYSRLRDAILFTLPDDLSVLPQELLEVSLQRMQGVLDQQKDCPDRMLALKLLRRLPQEQLAQLPSSYIAMCHLEVDGELDSSEDHHTGEEETSVKRKSRRRLLRRIKTKWHEVSLFGLAILLAPKPILKLVPSYAVDFMPDWSLASLPTSALERLPNELIAKLQIRHLERFPSQLLEKLPESLLRRMPRSTLERLPKPLLERLPTELLRKFPPELIENIPEGLTDQIGEVIRSRAFENDTLKQELSERVRELLRVTLVTASGELPAAAIQVSVLTNARKRTDKKLLKHEDLQEHILNMNRVHSKMVAQVPLLGMGEEKVYSGLRTKMEDIWQVMRLHPSRKGRSFVQNF